MARPRPVRRGRHWLTAGLCALAGGCDSTAPPVAGLSGNTMGTAYSIQLSPLPSAGRLARLRDEVEHRLEEVNRQMSHYRADSALSRFNRSPSTDWQPVPAPLVDLVERAQAISRQTGGHYDVTVAPLVDLWGFGSGERRETPPPAAAIDRALGRVGFTKLSTRRSPPALRKAVASLQIDLSSIAKGWATDQLAELLRAHGQAGFLVEIGGEVRGQGRKSDGTPWRIAVERPIADRRAAAGLIEVRDFAVATSGDYRNFFEYAGERYSHTIDPRTGRAVRHRLAAVTVIADTCADADAWATALLALGETRGPALADRLGLKALFMVRGDDGFEEISSRALLDAGLWQGRPANGD